MPSFGSLSPEHIKLLLTRAEREGMDAAVLERLTIILHFAQHHHSVSETCRQFNISRSTFHRWMERFDPNDLATLADKPYTPQSYRSSAIDRETIDVIRGYRMRYLQMGKERIAELLFSEHGISISSSSVGRVIERQCFYFADTPLHWKKRMEHTCALSTQPDIDAVSPQSLGEVPVRPEEHASAHIIISPEEMGEISENPRALRWSGLKPFVVVLSVITNLVFVSILISIALIERMGTEATDTARVPVIDIEQHVLHAAPPQVNLP